MTQTLTTEELRQIVETDHTQCGDAAAMARELLANREAQPVLAAPIYQILDDDCWYDTSEHIWRETYDECCESQFRIVYTAPPAPAARTANCPFCGRRQPDGGN